MRPTSVALIGGAIGLLIAAVNAFVNRGDVSLWSWFVVPLVVAVLFLWLARHFEHPKA
jgi:phosphate/sulfate permease